MAKGYIKLYRQLQECEIWAGIEPFDMRSAWVDLLMLANHSDKQMLFDYKPVLVKRGQYMTSVRQLGARWSWSKNRVLKYLRLLENLKMITRDSNKQRTLLTIVNYEVYQGEQDTDVDTPMDTDMDTGMPQLKNEKNIYISNISNNPISKKDKDITKSNKSISNKHIYGEYKHIRLTDTERDRLFNDYGEAETLEAIKYLDEYIEMKGTKYKSHYLAMKKWVFDAIKRKGGSSQGQGQTQSLADKWLNA